MSNPISISLSVSGQPQDMFLGQSEDTPWPDVIEYRATRAASVNDIFGLGQFGSIGQAIDYASAKWDLATIREFVRIAGQVRGEANVAFIKSLFNYNVNVISSAPATPYAYRAVSSALINSAINITLPFLSYPLSAYTSSDVINSVKGTVDRVKYDITFVTIESDWGSKMLGSVQPDPTGLLRGK